MPEPSDRAANKQLPAESVISLFATRLPHLKDGVGQDRKWVWFSGAKPSDEDRKALIELGFSFTARDHALPDGRIAKWFHPCGGFVKRTGRSDRRSRLVNGRQQSSASEPAGGLSAADLSELESLANRLP